MDGVALLQRCQALVEQGDFEQAITLLNERLLPGLRAVQPGVPAAQNTLDHSSSQELVECAALVQRLLQTTKAQQRTIQQHLQTERKRKLGRNAYTNSGAAV